MTLEEFKAFAEEQIRKGEEVNRRKWESDQMRLKNHRSRGLERDFITKEGHYWLVVKNNRITDICDTRGEAWRLLYS